MQKNDRRLEGAGVALDHWQLRLTRGGELERDEDTARHSYLREECLLRHTAERVHGDVVGAYGEMMRWFSTDVTPGAERAARSASRFSAHERTVPFKTTWLPCTSTVMCWASV